MKGRKKSSFDAATDALDEIVGDGGMYPSITMVAAACAPLHTSLSPWPLLRRRSSSGRSPRG